MEKNLDAESQPKKRIRLGKRIAPKEETIEVEEEVAESQENSTQNTRKKILPARANRGARMKSLQGMELKGENELYDLIFAEKSSDEDFNPSHTELSIDDSMEGRPEIEENIEENEEASENCHEVDKKKQIIKKKKIEKGAGTKISKKKQEEEIIDLDMIDLDQIDEMEARRDRGEEVDEFADDENADESDISSKEVKTKKKKKLGKKIAKPVILVQNNEAVENDARGKFIGKKLHRRKAFIDYSDDEDNTRKKNRQFKEKERGRKTKSAPLRISKNRNVLFKNNYEVMIVNKSIFQQESAENSEDEQGNNAANSEYDEEDIMKYNDEENKNTKNIIKKFKKQEKSESAPVRYTFLHEKLSQKELLLEAIFTEYYNIQSLQEMQRLDDLNKKEMSAPGKKQFAEFVRIVKGFGPDEAEDIVEENLEGEEKEEKKESDKEEEKKIRRGNTVTFSNPVIYEKIFESFNRPAQVKIETKIGSGMVSTTPLVQPTLPKERKVCVITGQPAKYFDPLTKQPYADKEAFKILRERYFQKEEDSLLFRIQTLSDLASQKKEKLKKLILSEGNSCKDNATASKNILSMVNRYGILKNDGGDLEKKVISHRIYNRNRENCVESGMLVEANKKILVISKKIFRDKYSNRGAAGNEDEKL